MENSPEVPRKVKHRITTWSRNSTPRYRPKRNEYMSIQQLIEVALLVLFIIAKTWKQTKCLLTYEWITKLHLATQWNSIPPQNRSTNTCDTMDEPWKHDAQWKKSDTKDHILYDSIYMKRPESGQFLSMQDSVQGWMSTRPSKGPKWPLHHCDNQVPPAHPPPFCKLPWG